MFDKVRSFSMLTITLLMLLFPAWPVIAADQTADLQVVDRIKGEAFDRSQVMDTLYYLTDIYGPRLTGSPEYDQAARWAMERLKSYGISDVHTEEWPFGRSWSLQASSVELLEPRYGQLTAAPLAWSSSTNGPVSGEPILAPLETSYYTHGLKRLQDDFDTFRKTWTGKLRGRIVLLSEPKTPPPPTKPAFERYTDAELADMKGAPEPRAKQAVKSIEELKWPEDPEELMKFYRSLPRPIVEEIFDRVHDLAAARGKFFSDEGVLAILLEDSRAHEGLVFSQSAGGYKASETLAPATFVVTAEQYNRIARAVEKKLPVKVRVNLQASISDKDVNGSNIIGEIPGRTKKEETVMIGGHFDSWHSGTGATDNAAGSAVMIEVMRILKALDLKLDRTVKIGLWGGEEQSFLGSKAYVKAHLGDPKTMQPGPEHARLSGYFNFDNGSGKIRGIYLQGNEAARPLFEQWLSPFRDMGVTTITIRDTGGTDHLSFNRVGLPGFQFIQDPLDYNGVTHHSDMDTYDHVVQADLMQAAAVIATVVYQTANLPQMLPRRQLPKPEK